MSDHPCHWAGDDRPRMLRSHHRDCNAADCPGCQPCPERHCGACLATTRTTLQRIRSTTTLMTTAALERGTNSLAALHAGPTANVEAWGHVYASLKAGRLCRCRTVRGQRCPATLPDATGPLCRKPLCAHPSCIRIRGLCPDLIAWTLDCRDELHPLWVLGTWDFNVRDHYGHLIPVDGDHDERRLTLDDTATYLDTQLTALAHDEDFAFEDMAHEIQRCAEHLDQVLQIAPYTETGAPCPLCGRADLAKSYGTDEADDRWTCPKCLAWWTERDYRAKGTYVAVASALTASQIRETYRVPEGTTRSWAQRGRVAKRGKDQQGRMLYDVAHVLACRDQEPATA